MSGKLRGQRAKAMKFVDGYMVKTGNPKVMYVDFAVRHVKLRQGLCSSFDAISFFSPDGDQE